MNDLVYADGTPIPEGILLNIGNEVVNIDYVMLKMVVRAIKNEVEILTENLYEANVYTENDWFLQAKKDADALRRLQRRLEDILYKEQT